MKRSGSSVAVVGGGLGGWRGLRGGVARARRHALRQERLARRQAAGAARGRLPLRHGPTILTVPGCWSGSSPNPAARCTTTWTCAGLTRNGAASSTTAAASTCARTSPPWRRRWTASPRPGAPARLPAVPGDLRAPAWRVGKILLLEAGPGPVRHHQHPGNMNPARVKDVLSLRMHASVASSIRGKVKDARLAQMLDHFVQYVGSRPTAPGGLVRHRPHAGGRGRVVPDGRHPRRRRGAEAAGAGSRRHAQARPRGRGSGDREGARSRVCAPARVSCRTNG